MHPRGQPPLLCAGLVGHLMRGAPQQLLGLLSGFDGHLLRLLLGEAPLPASGFTGTLRDTGSLLLGDVSRISGVCQAGCRRVLCKWRGRARTARRQIDHG